MSILTGGRTTGNALVDQISGSTDEFSRDVVTQIDPLRSYMLFPFGPRSLGVSRGSRLGVPLWGPGLGARPCWACLVAVGFPSGVPSDWPRRPGVTRGMFGYDCNRMNERDRVTHELSSHTSWEQQAGSN